MKAKRLRLALLVSAVPLLTIATYNTLAWNQEPTSQVPSVARPAEPTRDAMNRTQLRAVLGNVGVFVGDAQQLETPDHKALTVHWRSGSQESGTAQSEKPKGSGVLTFSASSTRTGAAVSPSNFELSTAHTLVIAVDEGMQLMWWNQFPDPRILRAEAPDASGQQQIGRTLYLSATAFRVAYPNNPAIKELRFYQPIWTSKGFELELIGSVSVK